MIGVGKRFPWGCPHCEHSALVEALSSMRSFLLRSCYVYTKIANNRSYKSLPFSKDFVK